MQKAKKIIIGLIISFFFIFVFFFKPAIEGIKKDAFFNTVADSDVIIVFNSGGWGDTPLEKATDFTPIIKGIEETLTSFGYKSVIVPYCRTRSGFWGKLADVKEFLNSFSLSSKTFADNLQEVIERYPTKKIILAGLSNGGVFVTNTYKEVSDEFKGSIYAIAAGTPFWGPRYDSANLLKIDNGGRDSLSSGDIEKLLLPLFKAPFAWLSSKITGQDVTIAQSFRAPGHEYDWNSAEVSSKITDFLENRFK